ncbi:MAG: hypothetical protein ACOYOU_18730, partial [Kiritimatiellia bacterium]
FQAEIHGARSNHALCAAPVNRQCLYISTFIALIWTAIWIIKYIMSHVNRWLSANSNPHYVVEKTNMLDPKNGCTLIGDSLRFDYRHGIVKTKYGLRAALCLSSSSCYFVCFWERESPDGVTTNVAAQP